MELSSLPARDLIDEAVNLDPDGFDTLSALDRYSSLVESNIRRQAENALPVFAEYMNAYDPAKISECGELRFSAVSTLAIDIDRFEFRLRGTTEGQKVIASLEKALQRIIAVDPDTTFDNGAEGRRHPIAFIALTDLTGINDVDRNIADTLWVRFKIRLSDKELQEFSDYLISKDPKYPKWSKHKFIKDHSRINEAGSPLQVYVFDDAKRFRNAYLEFKASRNR